MHIELKYQVSVLVRVGGGGGGCQMGIGGNKKKSMAKIVEIFTTSLTLSGNSSVTGRE